MKVLAGGAVVVVVLLRLLVWDPSIQHQSAARAALDAPILAFGEVTPPVVERSVLGSVDDRRMAAGTLYALAGHCAHCS